MGCGASSKKVVAAVAVAPAAARSVAPAEKRSKFNTASKFQWKSGKGWNDYDRPTDARLKQAFLVGRQKARFDVNTGKGNETYDFDFSKNHMEQKNIVSNKPRDMRAPQGMYPP